jgi:SAM-dependent MidA family methyltransferase
VTGEGGTRGPPKRALGRVEAVGDLKRRLLERIASAGPITFAEFMEAALYDPEQGFYARPPIGESGHFVTSPHVSPAFGDLLARQLADCWEVLGRPRPFSVVELGAGDGTLGEQIAAAAGSVPELAEALGYVAVERSAGAREALRGRGFEAHANLVSVGRITGCVIANEVLDNVPFRRIRKRGGDLVEVLVGSEGDRLVEVERPVPGEILAEVDGRLRDGGEHPISAASRALIREMAASLERGYAFVFDYGFGAGESPGPVHSYRDQDVLPEVLAEPGSRDVTAAVDWKAIAGEAERAGLQVWGPLPQREALLGLGYRMWSAGVRRRQAEAEEEGDWRTATRLYGARSRASILIDPAKLGGLQVLALGTDGLPTPAAVLGDRDAGC